MRCSRRSDVMLAFALLVAGVALGSERGPLELGQRLYREGLSSSGQPVHAVVEHDVEVSGAQLSCVACHGRSGLGSIEGRRVVPPIAAPFLATERPLRSRPRPAYSDAALVRAIVEGVDPAGHPLDSLMPRYHLAKDDAVALVAYLRQLSAKPDPGVQGDEIHFATVVEPGAAPSSREAMLRMMQVYFRLKTANAIDNRQRHIASWPEYFGKWVLHVWKLEGAPSTWRRQLDAHYRAQPVFALVSGIGEDWTPVDRFCEDRQLPCLLPNVDSPPEVRPGGYSLYFSGGTALEAAAIASSLSREEKPQRVLQVYVRGSEGEHGARALIEKVHGSRDRVIDLAIAAGQTVGAAKIVQSAEDANATAVVLWLGRDELAHVGDTAELRLPVYFSSMLLDGDFASARALEVANGMVVQPFALPSDSDVRFRRVSSWLTSQRITSSPREQRIEDQTFFALTVLSEGFMHLKKNFIRDYLLEAVDHFSGFENFSSFYPKLSFGPGQRVLSKGCYLIPLAGGGHAEWLVP
jgi:hypothetical protein